MEKKEVVFDGKNLSFPIDGVMIVNGELPSTFEIKESYLIDGCSLGKLVVALGNGIVLIEDIIRCFYSKSVTRKIYSNSCDLLELIADENKDINQDNNKLREENKRLREEIKMMLERNNTLASKISKHNNSSWINRIRKIKEEIQ